MATASNTQTQPPNWKNLLYRRAWVAPIILTVIELAFILLLGRWFSVLWPVGAMLALVAWLAYAKLARYELLLSVVVVLGGLITVYTVHYPLISWLENLVPYTAFALLIRRTESRRALFNYGFWIGLMIYAGSAPWIWFSMGRFWNPEGAIPPFHVMLGGPFLVFLIVPILQGLQTAIFMAVTGHLSHRLRAAPFAVLFILSNVVVEHWFPFPFTHESACLIVEQPLLIQVFDLFGARGYTIMFCAASAAIYVLLTPEERKNRRQVYIWGGILIFIPLFQLGYGMYKMHTLAPRPGEETLDVALVQPCSPLHISSKDPKDRQQVADEMLRLSRAAIKSGPRPPDLLIWPEGATAFSYANPAYHPEYMAAVRKLQSETSVTMLLSDLAFLRPPPGTALKGETAKYRYLNHISLVGPDRSVVGEYTKVFRLPFTEYLPGEQLLIKYERFGLARYLRQEYRKIFPETRTIAEGLDYSLLDGPKRPFGAPICYEVIFDAPIRSFARQGAFYLVNVANDEWFRSDMEKQQHLMNGILRSVEYRLPLVRATNTGISAIVDSRGVIARDGRAPIGKPSFLRGTVTLRPAGSFYTRYGHLLPGWVLTPLFALIWIQGSIRTRLAESKAKTANRAKPGRTPRKEPPSRRKKES